MAETKFIFVTGGVVSSLGKGITASCVGRLLKNRGLKVFMQKFDPYINYDPGTMSPYQHGEVFVTEDGAETDLDLGHYERFIDEPLNKNSNVTTGKVYSNVIEKERKGHFNGGTVQVIPHITNEIKSYLYRAKQTGADVVITEIGGTVGDIEGQPFLEAIRQARREFGYENTFYIHVTLIPYLKSACEIKTKPTQHSVRELKSLGLHPDMIMLRTEVSIPQEHRQKIAAFCDVDDRAVIEAKDVDIVYDLVNRFHEQHVDDIICEHFKLDTAPVDLKKWNEMIDRIKHSRGEVTIALVGKYTSLKDAYISVNESLYHAGYCFKKRVKIKRIESDNINSSNVKEILGNVDGILVPGGFGIRGIEGKIEVCRYARENNIPFFGICLGMQVAIIEYARNVAGLQGANSSEFDENTPYKVIDFLPGQYQGIDIGGTLRLGNYECQLNPTSKPFKYYKKTNIFERHRHRYEFNNEFKNILGHYNLKYVGINPQSNLVEMIEVENHPYYVACQFHPEFKSRPDKPHPLFVGFIDAAIKHKREKGEHHE